MNLLFSQRSDEGTWERFLLTQRTPPFLQSWHMKALHERLGDVVHMITMKDAEEIVGIACAIEIRAKRGSYLYLPYGPVWKEGYWKCFDQFTDYMLGLGKEHSIDFIRSSPFLEDTPEHAQLYAGAGWRRSPLHVIAEHVWWLDCTQPEENLLKGMRKTMRQQIRRAERDGVHIEMHTDLGAVEEFVRIHSTTAKRHGFVPYTDDYFRAEMQAFIESDSICVFLAHYNNTVIAAAIIVFYGDMASYHHGASLTEYSKIPASYLLQWNAIQEAQRRGCTTYNFWGVVPEHKMYSPLLHRPHPFTGVTTFKKGFGGSLFNLLPCHDIPLTPMYHLTRGIEIMRRIRRGFF